MTIAQAIREYVTSRYTADPEILEKIKAWLNRMPCVIVDGQCFFLDNHCVASMPVGRGDSDIEVPFVTDEGGTRWATTPGEWLARGLNS